MIDDVSASRVRVSVELSPTAFSPRNVTATEVKKLSTLPVLGVVKVMPPVWYGVPFTNGPGRELPEMKYSEFHDRLLFGSRVPLLVAKPSTVMVSPAR